MRKIISIILILSFAAGLTGCETLQRKFTRKSKKRIIRPKFYSEAASEKRPNLELYIMHYTYWEVWQEDLVVNAGKNNKRDRMAEKELVGHLNDMKKYLVEDKAKELGAYIKEAEDIASRMTKSGVEMRLGYLKQKLNKNKARIARKFYYKKVREYIKHD